MITIGTFVETRKAKFQIFAITADGHTASAVNLNGDVIDMPVNTLVALYD